MACSSHVYMQSNLAYSGHLRIQGTAVCKLQAVLAAPPPHYHHEFPKQNTAGLTEKRRAPTNYESNGWSFLPPHGQILPGIMQWPTTGPWTAIIKGVACSIVTYWRHLYRNAQHCHIFTSPIPQCTALSHIHVTYTAMHSIVTYSRHLYRNAHATLSHIHVTYTAMHSIVTYSRHLYRNAQHIPLQQFRDSESEVCTWSITTAKQHSVEHLLQSSVTFKSMSRSCPCLFEDKSASLATSERLWATSCSIIAHYWEPLNI